MDLRGAFGFSKIYQDSTVIFLTACPVGQVVFKITCTKPYLTCPKSYV